MSPPRLSRASIGARRNPETEQAILDAAEELIVEAGYPGLTMDAVARRASASKATLYKWWPSRSRLLLAVYARRKAELPLADTGSLRGDMIAFFKDLFGFWMASPVGDLFRLLIAEAQSDAEVITALKGYAAERRRDTEIIFGRAEKRGDLRPGVLPSVGADIVVAIAWNRLLTGRMEDKAGVAILVDHLLAGFEAPVAAGPSTPV